MTDAIIVADNDSLMRGILRSILIGMDQTVMLATCGEEVLALARRQRAKLFLLDLDMPRLNGLVTCERLRASPSHSETPIAILTALGGEPARRAAARVGATLFLSKPIRPATLIQALSPYLGVTVIPGLPPARMVDRATGGGSLGERAR